MSRAKSRKSPRIFAGGAVFLLLISGAVLPALAGPLEETTQTSDFPFARGTKEAALLAGSFFSFSTTSAKRPTINYQLEAFRLGWTHDDPRHGGILRGNNEFLIEAFGGPVIKGGGSFLSGASLLWQYHFIQPGAKLIPYIQLGAGGLGNDIHTDPSQREVGGGFEFILQAGGGLRWMLNERWALDAEAGYRHISNADLYSRNQGLNSFGGLIGVSWFFR